MKHSDFDLRWHSYEPRRLLPQLPLGISRQLFLRCSMINWSPRFALRYVQTHWKKTLNRKLLSARNCMWIKAQTSQAKKPLIMTRPARSTSQPSHLPAGDGATPAVHITVLLGIHSSPTTAPSPSIL